MVSNLASYTITCEYEGTDDPTVSWTVGGTVVSDTDDGISITPGTLTDNARFVYNISLCFTDKHFLGVDGLKTEFDSLSVIFT